MTDVAGGIPMACEWCEGAASYRIKARRSKRRGTYMRFACERQAHRVRLDRLVAIDLGPSERRETMINPTGFSVTGRMLGPKDCI